MSKDFQAFPRQAVIEALLTFGEEDMAVFGDIPLYRRK